MEYLVTMTTHVPDGTPEQAVDDVRAREATHSRDLATERRVGCCGCGARRCSRANGAVSACLPPPTPAS